MSGVVGVTVLARHDHDADQDRHGGDGGFHLLDASDGVGCIRVGIMLDGVGVIFPTAVAFVADFPVFEVAMVSAVGRGNPRGGLGWRATAVIHRGENLRAEVGGEIAEASIAIRVGRPVIGVRGRAAGPAQGSDADGLEGRQG